jgi:hypothetical protein
MKKTGAAGGKTVIQSGRSSVVELLLPKQVVEGSNPFARSSLKPAQDRAFRSS